MFRRLTVLVLCVAGLAAVGAATASAGGFYYEKQGDPINGRIQGQCGYQCVTSWYRAGSGGNLPQSGCVKYNWLPNGTYNVRLHSDSYNLDIKGRVWYLSDYYCSATVTRDQLFVHTEETASNGQMCGSPYDERYCWDGEGDYHSVGCIKVRRLPVDSDGTSHIGKLDAFHHNTSNVTTVWVAS